MIDAPLLASLLLAAQDAAETAPAASEGPGVIYGVFVLLHSLLRWLVVFLGLGVIIRAVMGWQKGQPFTPGHRGMNAGFMGSVHLNVVVGLFLYIGLSPTTQAAFADFGGAMKNSVLRFWAVEHITLMLLAAVFATLGNIRSKKADTDAGKHKAAAIFFGIAYVLIFLGIPWWFRGEVGRPLLWLPF